MRKLFDTGGTAMEKIYNSMKTIGAANLVMGIILMIVGLTTGILMVVNGASLLRHKNKLTF